MAFAIAVTAAAITPGTPRPAEGPGIAVYDGSNAAAAWKDAPTGWEISLADGTLDPAAAAEVLASIGWEQFPGGQWLMTAPGKYIADVIRKEDG